MRRLIALMMLLLLPAVAVAAPSCVVPGDLAAPHAEVPGERDAPRTVPIGGYTLAMFWMPQHCRRPVAGIGDVDCRSRAVAAHDLTLHGLWPDGQGATWPQWCRPAAILPRRTIAVHFCATPSPQLLQHEWAKHGTCMPGYTPDRYFDLSNRLFAGFRTPDLRALSYRRPTVEDVRRAVASANPGIGPDMLRLNLDKQGWLEEVWLCLDTAFRPRRCEAAARGPQPADPVLIWRGGRDRERSRNRR